MNQIKKARKVYAGVFLGLGGLLALIAMSLGGPVRTVAADDSSAPGTSPVSCPVSSSTCDAQLRRSRAIASRTPTET